MKAENIMSSDLTLTHPHDTLARTAQLMWENDLGFLPVVNPEGALVGVITDRDICMAAFTRGIRLDDANVESVMSRNVHTLPPAASLQQIEAMMQECQVRRLPVVDEFRTLIGVVTVGDLARYVAHHGVTGALNSPAIAKTMAAVAQPAVQKERAA